MHTKEDPWRLFLKVLFSPWGTYDLIKKIKYTPWPGVGISPCHNYWQFSPFINRKLLHTPTTHTFDTDTSQPAFVCQIRIFINQLRKEHFELLRGSAVSQEPSSGTVTIFFPAQQCFCNYLKFFITPCPYGFIKISGEMEKWKHFNAILMNLTQSRQRWK